MERRQLLVFRCYITFKDLQVCSYFDNDVLKSSFKMLVDFKLFFTFYILLCFWKVSWLALCTVGPIQIKVPWLFNCASSSTVINTYVLWAAIEWPPVHTIWQKQTVSTIPAVCVSVCMWAELNGAINLHWAPSGEGVGVPSLITYTHVHPSMSPTEGHTQRERSCPWVGEEMCLWELSWGQTECQLNWPWSDRGCVRRG